MNLFYLSKACTKCTINVCHVRLRNPNLSDLIQQLAPDSNTFVFFFFFFIFSFPLQLFIFISRLLFAWWRTTIYLCQTVFHTKNTKASIHFHLVFVSAPSQKFVIYHTLAGSIYLCLCIVVSFGSQNTCYFR